FGWFGFNAGSAMGANGLAAAAFLNTLAAGCTGLLGWLLVEHRRDGHPTTLGAASGAVAGLVAITPSCGTVSLTGALVVGLAAGAVCSYAVSWKFKLNYDDSLDVVGVHLVGGIIGTLLIGLFAVHAMTGGTEGLLYGGGLAPLGRQLLAVAAVAVYAFSVTYGLGRLLDRVMGLRASEEQEHTGLDLTVHAETAYDHGVLGHGAPAGASPVVSSVQKVRSQA
ncbi:ammonium transporter, partial [Streptomyces anandii]|uniref:ammonium transporter n=1 Tax=Streptomyces anandii TaxID=285454 RepID=UPI003570BDA6